jgi:hypothetical protein
MAGKKDLVRYREVRRADVLDDQKSASEILDANSSLTQEQLQELILSQIKRIIWDSQTGHWNDDFITNEISALYDLSRGTPAFNAACEATDIIGDLVCISGPPSGGLIATTRVDITNNNRMPSVGIIINKTSPIRCRVQTTGLVPYTGLVPGKRYFVGYDGRPTTPPPTPPVGGSAFSQPIGTALDGATLLLTPSPVFVKLHG